MVNIILASISIAFYGLVQFSRFMELVIACSFQFIRIKREGKQKHRKKSLKLAKFANAVGFRPSQVAQKNIF